MEIKFKFSNIDKVCAVLIAYKNGGRSEINGVKYELRVLNEGTRQGKLYDYCWYGAPKIDDFLNSIQTERFENGNWSEYLLGYRSKTMGFWDMGEFQELRIGLFANYKEEEWKRVSISM